jgi:hypothetical protein
LKKRVKESTNQDVLRAAPVDAVDEELGSARHVEKVASTFF